VTIDVRFWVQSGHDLLRCTCLLLTQSGRGAVCRYLQVFSFEQTHARNLVVLHATSNGGGPLAKEAVSVGNFFYAA
jgi:hypothetical protein